jgi:hypothetical protein
MEEIFSSNSKEVIQKQLNICLDNKLTLKSKDELDFYFDVSKITIWIQENQFKRVITNSETIEVKANFRIEPNRTKLDRTELNPINSIFSNRFQISYFFYKKFGLTEQNKNTKIILIRLVSNRKFAKTSIFLLYYSNYFNLSAFYEFSQPNLN